MSRSGLASIGVLLVLGCTTAKPQASDAVAGERQTAVPSNAPAGPDAAQSTGSPGESLPAAAAATESAQAGAGRRTPVLAPFYRQKLAWQACGGGFHCTKVTVPLDYAKPAGERIQIAMIKLPARKRSGRIGSLFINPGGPGGSGVQYARYAESAIPGQVRDRFDIVGFDPRGVGESAPVRCGTAEDVTRWLAVDPSPDTEAELRDFVAAAKEFGQGCLKRTGPAIRHIGTRNAARDLDVMRALVSDSRLTFMGKSYGTYLGALYADMFPKRVRALVLDGAVDPTVDTQTLGRVQAKGFEVALSAFLADCDKSSACVFGKAPDINGRFDALLARIERQPLQTSSGRTVGPDEAYYGIAQALYSRQSGWPALRIALAQAERGDGSVLLALFDQYVDRDSNGDYSNLIESYTAISCVDRPSPRNLAAYQADARRQAAESPHFGPAAAFSGLPCAYWPVPAAGPPTPLRARGSAPILVIGTTRDPATPLVWSQALAGQLDAGRLLTYNGDGHTVYGDGNDCVDRAGNAYLISLKLPAAGKRCG